MYVRVYLMYNCVYVTARYFAKFTESEPEKQCITMECLHRCVTVCICDVVWLDFIAFGCRSRANHACQACGAAHLVGTAHEYAPANRGRVRGSRYESRGFFPMQRRKPRMRFGHSTAENSLELCRCVKSDK